MKKVLLLQTLTSPAKIFAVMFSVLMGGTVLNGGGIIPAAFADAADGSNNPSGLQLPEGVLTVSQTLQNGDEKIEMTYGILQNDGQIPLTINSLKQSLLHENDLHPGATLGVHWIGPQSGNLYSASDLTNPIFAAKALAEGYPGATVDGMKIQTQIPVGLPTRSLHRS